MKFEQKLNKDKDENSTCMYDDFLLYTVTLAKIVLVVVLGHNNYNQNNCS